LLAVDRTYREPGGEFVVLVDPANDTGRIYGAHAVLPFADRPGICTFRRLYLDPSLRGGETGTRLMQWAIDWAAGQGLVRVEFWSDTRFTRAHRFFERLGFVRTGEIREMNDGAMPYREYFFWRSLVG
jgi:GNAT superfamily N-acetyltransferase